MARLIRLVGAAAVLLGLPLSGAGDPSDDVAHFHHVHLNSTDPRAGIDFYTTLLGATEVKYRGKADALFTERSFILITRVPAPPPRGRQSALDHIGWAGINGPVESAWLKAQGVEFETEATRLGREHYIYFYGRERELIEIFTGGRNHRFDHVHLWASDVDRTSRWFIDHLGIAGARTTPRPTERPARPDDRESIIGIWRTSLRVDNVRLSIFGKPDFETVWWPKDQMGPDFAPTRGRNIDHIAFSYRNIGPVFERMRASGVEIVEPVSTKPDTGITSFFVLAPDRLLVEIVEERAIPGDIWR